MEKSLAGYSARTGKKPDELERDHKQAMDVALSGVCFVCEVVKHLGGKQVIGYICGGEEPQ